MTNQVIEWILITMKMSNTYYIKFLIKIHLYEEAEEFNGILGRNDIEDSSPDSTAFLWKFWEKKNGMYSLLYVNAYLFH